jgi:hypothetical protein
MTNAWCHDTARDAAVRAAEDNRTGPLPTLGEAIARPFADAAERSPTVSKTGEPQSGMRTERVTLEVTQLNDGGYKPASEWNWDFCFRGESPTDGESVRVVDTHAEAVAESVAWEGARDAYRGRILRLTEERDAAIRERDAYQEEYYKLRAARITQSLTADRFAAAVSEADTLRARVAELEADVNDCNIILGNRWRDAVSVVTGKAAPAASSGGEQSNQPLADGGRPRGERAESATADSSPSLSLDTPGAPADGADPTASGGGEGEPVAISPAERDGLQVIVDGVVRHGNGFVVVPGSDSLRAVESVLARHTTAPPQPRGWLTQEERALVQSWERHYTQGAHYAQSPSHTNDIAAEMGKLAEVCRAFLARSSPPEVVLESWREAAGEVVSLDDVRAALAAIGVVVKEVGRE